jgi:hypothetical protein
MNPAQYRVISFDQSVRANAGYKRRDQLMLDAIQNPENSDLVARAEAGTLETDAVQKIGGVCRALALKWLKVKFKENSNADRQKAGPRVGIIDRDKTFDRAFQRYAAHNADQRYGLEEYYGMSATFDPNLFQKQPGGLTSYVAKTVAHSKHGYFLHAIRCPKLDDISHAIAYYTSSGKVFSISSHVYMFDPDFGEYKIPNSDFISWMPKFVKSFYGTGEEHTLCLETMSLGTKRATP